MVHDARKQHFPPVIPDPIFPECAVFSVIVSVSGSNPDRLTGFQYTGCLLLLLLNRPVYPTIPITVRLQQLGG